MKPILFNTEMVRAILEGCKTVTRRVVKHNPCECESKQLNGICKLCDDKGGFFWPNEYVKARSLYRPGDILYVRETWERSMAGTYLYKATDTPLIHDGWRPSIHMPREASRIFLRVTDVRVEQLQDIDDDGVVAEGLNIGDPFDELWDSTIKPADRALYGWTANPWVWVIQFERCERPKEVCPHGGAGEGGRLT